MSFYLATSDFFVEELIPVPPLTISWVNESTSTRQKCMCFSRELHTRLSAGIDQKPFTLSIICHSLEGCAAALDIQKRYQNKYRHLRMSRAAQFEMFSDLRSVCECGANSSEEDPAPFPGIFRTCSQASSSGSSGIPTFTPHQPCKTDEKKRKNFETDPTSAPARAEKQSKASSPAEVSSFQRTGFATALDLLQSADRKSIINEEVAKQVREAVKNPYREQSEGRIYWVASPSNPSKLFLSCTLIDSPKTKQQHISQCLQDARLTGYISRVPNVQEVMCLISAELTLHAEDLNCATCGLRHSNWFEIDVDLAEAVVLRWSKWMAGIPYDSSNGRLHTKWEKRTWYSRLHYFEPAAVADLDRDNADTWGWWTRLMDMDAPPANMQLPPVKLRRVS